MPNAFAVVRSVILFLVAGVCEIGGGWLVWKWLRDHKPGWWGLLGGLVLILYGVIPTLQTSHFGRIYAAYGGCSSCCLCSGAGDSMGIVPTGPMSPGHSSPSIGVLRDDVLVPPLKLIRTGSA